MKQFENKVLFIENEEIQEEVLNLVETKNYTIDYSNFSLSKMSNSNYFQYDRLEHDFFLGFKTILDQEITLEEFKQLLNQ